MLYFFVVDRKVIYALTGVYGASGTYPCPFCVAKNIHMDHTINELCQVFQVTLTLFLPVRSKVQDLRSKPGVDKLQKNNNYNLFSNYRATLVTSLPHRFI